jgi:hypothetical protein
VMDVADPPEARTEFMVLDDVLVHLARAPAGGLVNTLFMWKGASSPDSHRQTRIREQRTNRRTPDSERRPSRPG